MYFKAFYHLINRKQFIIFKIFIIMEAQKVLNTDLIDIVFEGRNKQYGAYSLRKDYQKNVKKALFVGALAISFSISAPLLYSKIMSNANLSKAEEKVVNITMTEVEIEHTPPPIPPPPPKQVQPPSQTTVKYMPPVVKPDDLVQKEELPIPPKESENAGVEKVNGTGIQPIDEIPVKETPLTEVIVPKEDNGVCQVVEQQAEFQGGTTELMKYLRDNIKYPAIARDGTIQGRVVLRFVIEKDGSVNGITVLKSVHELLDKEAIRVVKSMPSWKAGKQGGRNVRSYFTLPVNFKLEG